MTDVCTISVHGTSKERLSAYRCRGDHQSVGSRKRTRSVAGYIGTYISSMESFNAATTLQVSYKKPLLSSVDHWDDWIEAVDHWDDWIEALQSFAEGQGFWSEVNPDNPELPADALVQPRVATSVECQEFISKESTPTNPVTLHDAIQYHLMLYQEQVRRYKEQESKERTIHSWMASTVLPSVHASVLAKIRKDATTSHVTPRQVAKELKARFAQDSVVSSAATSSRYKDLLQQAHMANVEPKRWIADWNVIYQKGISQDILEVKGPNAIRDFLRAMGARFEPAWAHGKLAKLVEYNGTIPSTFTLTVTGLAEEFMRYRRATRVFDTRDNSVNATLGTQTSNNTNNPKPKGCPCNTFHKWQPHQCLAVYHAVTGQPVADIKPISKGACSVHSYQTTIRQSQMGTLGLPYSQRRLEASSSIRAYFFWFHLSRQSISSNTRSQALDPDNVHQFQSLQGHTCPFQQHPL
ncbi:hypothetical protein E4U48_004375 [Claviceps purpurea]|nr:hypothetical protein E4U48_004375 [Claviceps purpurea]